MYEGLLSYNVSTYNMMFDVFEELGVEVKDDQLYTITKEFLMSNDKRFMDLGAPEQVCMSGASLCDIHFNKTPIHTASIITMSKEVANSIVNVLTCIAYKKKITTQDLLTKEPSMYNIAYKLFRDSYALRDIDDIRDGARKLLSVYNKENSSEFTTVYKPYRKYEVKKRDNNDYCITVSVDSVIGKIGKKKRIVRRNQCMG